MHFALSMVLFLVASVAAKKSGGDFGVTINGQVFNPAQGQELKLDKQNTPVFGTIFFRGIHVNFDFSTTTFAINNYTLTGASDPLRLVIKPTIIFTQTVALSAAQTANPVLTRFEIKDDNVVLILNTAQGSFKIQAIDSAQGGTLQTEPEFGTAALTFTRVLGPTVFFFLNEFTGKVNFGNGIDAISQSIDTTNFHEMLLGKDSPEAATQLFQDGTTSRWLVKSGGRVAAVFGEDAIEQTPGADSCTSQCQNRDMIHGTLPVPPDPTNPVPLASASSAGVAVSTVVASSEMPASTAVAASAPVNAAPVASNGALRRDEGLGYGIYVVYALVMGGLAQFSGL